MGSRVPGSRGHRSWGLGPTITPCHFFSLKHIFHHKKVHIKWDDVISSSLRLLIKVWIWYRCQNRIENCYHQDEEQLGFYEKGHIKTQSMNKKKNVLVILHRKKWMSFNLFDKNCTQENVQLHLQHGESWPGGIVIKQVNYK